MTGTDSEPRAGWCVPDPWERLAAMTPAELIGECAAAAETEQERGNQAGALDVLEAALTAVIDALDPARAGQGLRLVPLPMADGMIDLPTVSLAEPGGDENRQQPSDTAVMRPIVEEARDAWDSR